MMLILFPRRHTNPSVHRLPEPDMDVDPRPNGGDSESSFVVDVNGTTLTITSINGGGQPGWLFDVTFRVYKSGEFHCPFDSTNYLYNGIDGERAPCEATEIIFKGDINAIKAYAFSGCVSLSNITIPNSITSIGNCAFSFCFSLQYIHLPSNLQLIGTCAFAECRELRILNVPSMVYATVGYDVVQGCRSLLTDETVDTYHERDIMYNERRQQDFHNLFTNRYNPLHNLCWDPSVTADDIQQYIQQHHNNHERARTNDKPKFTPLHLLTANPSVASDMISVYLRLAPDVATMQDNIGKTALHMLCSVPYSSDASGDAIRAYLAFEEGKMAAFVKDSEGRTPLGCLCERGFDEMMFLKNKSFGGLIMWWYDHCLGINFFAED